MLKTLFTIIILISGCVESASPVFSLSDKDLNEMYETVYKSRLTKGGSEDFKKILNGSANDLAEMGFTKSSKSQVKTLCRNVLKTYKGILFKQLKPNVLRSKINFKCSKDYSSLSIEIIDLAKNKKIVEQKGLTLSIMERNNNLHYYLTNDKAQLYFNSIFRDNDPLSTPLYGGGAKLGEGEAVNIEGLFLVAN
jgi:hypothetical protein